MDYLKKTNCELPGYENWSEVKLKIDAVKSTLATWNEAKHNSAKPKSLLSEITFSFSLLFF